VTFVWWFFLFLKWKKERKNKTAPINGIVCFPARNWIASVIVTTMCIGHEETVSKCGYCNLICILYIH
jgi:hypothetical protein